MAGSVLVTGGAGYIGSHAVLELLDQGRRPVVLDDLSTGDRAAVPAEVALYEGSVADSGLVARVLRDEGVAAVMHFAASISAPESVADPAKYYRNNTCASLSLATSCVETRAPILFIFSSSAAVYGEPDVSPVPEEAAARPINPYGASKRMTEIMLADMALAHPSFRPLCLRYFNVAGADPEGRAGPRNPKGSNLIPQAVAAALGRRDALDICGDDYDTRDGTGERDYIHVSDLAAAHVAALDYLQRGGAELVINCGYGRGVTVLEVVSALEKLTGRPLPVRRAPRRPGDAASAVSDVRRLRSALDWRPRHDDLGAILGSALAWQERL